MKKVIILNMLLLSVYLNLAQQVKPFVVNTLGGSSSYSGGYSTWSVGEPIIGTFTGSTTSLSQGFLQTWPALAREIVLRLYLQGLWNGSAMNKAQNSLGDAFEGEVADKVAVEFHNGNNYSQLIYTESEVNLLTSGWAIFTIPGTYTGSCYLTVKHRNSLNTTTALPITLSGSSVSYDFTDAENKAYGSNLIQLSEGVYGIYGGDINQDGMVNAQDIEQIGAVATLFETGYLSTDCNGDGVTDALDLIITDNNAAAFVEEVLP